jgi:hypothetical protein
MTRFRLFLIGLILLSSVVGLAQAASPKVKPSATTGKAAVQSVHTLSQQVLDKLVAREKDLVAAEQRHATAVIDEALADTFHEISSDGHLLEKAEIMPMIPDARIDDFSLEEFRLFPVYNDAVLVTYVANVKGNFKGQPLPAKSRLSSLWVRRHGSWQMVFHQATPVLEAK